MRRAPARPVRACFVRQWLSVPKVALETPHFTLHSSHFILRTYTSQSTLHLISSHLFSYVINVLNYVHFIRALLNLSHLIEALLNSSQLFFMSEGFCRQREVSCTQKPEKPLHTAHEKFLHTARFYAEKFLHTEAFTHSKLLHTASFYTQQAFNTEKLFHTASFYTEKPLDTDAFTHGSFYYTEKRLNTEALTYRTFYVLICAKHLPLLCTAKLAQSTAQYYFVLESLDKVLPSPTLYYKARKKKSTSQY